MATYEDASRTKDHYETDLFNRHPEIVSIAPQVELNDIGQPTGQAFIVIGVRRVSPLIYGPGTAAQQQMRAAIPKSLPVITAENVEGKEEVRVVVEIEDDLTLESFTAKRRPCPGGFSIGHFSVTAGTLGGVMREGNGPWHFVLSNNHVLAAQNAGRRGDRVYQPGTYDGGTQADTIGTLERFVPVDVSGADNEADCALAIVPAPPERSVSRNVQGIGIPQTLGTATVGQNIRKSGRTTEVTTGSIVSTNASLSIPFGGGTARFVNQLKYTRMTSGGDSGSLVWDRDSLTVIGLHFAGGSTASYGNKIQRVIALLNQARAIFTSDGEKIEFAEANFSLTQNLG